LRSKTRLALNLVCVTSGSAELTRSRRRCKRDRRAGPDPTSRRSPARASASDFRSIESPKTIGHTMRRLSSRSAASALPSERVVGFKRCAHLALLLLTRLCAPAAVVRIATCCFLMLGGRDDRRQRILVELARAELDYERRRTVSLQPDFGRTHVELRRLSRFAGAAHAGSSPASRPADGMTARPAPVLCNSRGGPCFPRLRRSPGFFKRDCAQSTAVDSPRIHCRRPLRWAIATQSPAAVQSRAPCRHDHIVRPHLQMRRSKASRIVAGLGSARSHCGF
jgi:hypothetical protein